MSIIKPVGGGEYKGDRNPRVGPRGREGAIQAEERLTIEQKCRSNLKEAVNTFNNCVAGGNVVTQEHRGFLESTLRAYIGDNKNYLLERGQGGLLQSLRDLEYDIKHRFNNDLVQNISDRAYAIMEALDNIEQP